ncbi:MAG: glycogen debranching enzyme N-terminal domain-containing protein [Kiritimatiellae bacterium]|nr:glycogen debranching enzyme N-terminal domain-containing protein [Kiritimatiellia bacterium]
MTQTPASESFLLKWRGDTLAVTLALDAPRPGRAAFRTNIGHARIRRREIIAETERGETPLARAWTDIPLAETAPGVFSAEIPLDEVGVFSGKACFFPEGSGVPEWPDGRNIHVKVEPAETRLANSIYTVFPRQFGSFREVARRLDHIMDRMGFRIVQTLPPFPVPTTYAVMGEYGCPFAATDFLSVDPAMAEFDGYTTPLDQFRELIDAVHARRGLFFVDLPANHTGWASTLQTHHPDWFRREADGRFRSPGAWGVTWADLVELDYSSPGLREYIADVFLFWCRNGVDGFRCDAGYMIPLKTWEYVVARVRDEYPETVFMLEGLGGDLNVTDALLAEANLDWAYSEIFQTFDRGAFEWYLPSAAARGERYGTLVHFAETHDNDRLAKGGETYAKLRVQLAALLSWQGAWGIANGVEWFCREKIDVHGKNDLAWGSASNMVDLIARLNHILRTSPSFAGACRVSLVTRGDGNVLAVLREAEGAAPVLVLANLDCGCASRVDWDRARFAYGEAFDLVTERAVSLSGAVELKPGEVLCLAARAAHPADARNLSPRPGRPEPLFHWVFPRDTRRTVVVPENEWVEVAAPHRFRLRLVDPSTGRTLRVCRSEDGASGPRALFDAPHYKGDGTRCRALDFEIVVYDPGGVRRAKSWFLVPPRSDVAKVKLSLTGEEVRRAVDGRTILSNGAGAAAQVRVGWGVVASQYDALLAANPNANVPSDRLNLWARTRCWLQREGYARELDAKCVRLFTADPAGRFARWDFRVPCGMGRECAFAFTLALAPGENTARLSVVREAAGANDADGSIRLVFRPDVEWRSFHETTKAYAGPEALFAQACRPSGDGVAFSPYDGTFELRVTGGEYHHEPQWTYNVAHPEEAARGQDASGDLFSPGWISADLKTGDAVEIVGRAILPGCEPAAAKSAPCPVEGERPSALPLATALRQALDLFIVRRDDLKTVIAGYPWFLDWGRDTFIFLRAMVADGRVDDSLRILRAFAAFEEKGTLPNIIYGTTAGNRDTTDAPLWFIRCVQEVEDCASVDRRTLAGLRRTCESIVDNYVRGTPNGIRVDPDSLLVWSPPHFTWMDTNYPACTPRVGYPVEIQALWISALRYLGRDEMAARALKSVKDLFVRRDGPGCFDCLAAPNGERAAQATPDASVRPNQLFLVTLGVLDDSGILRSAEELLVPGGMRSLGADDRLYCGVYAGDEDTRRKPAYHNGTVWGWVFPLYAEALAASGRCSRETALQLLSSSVETLNAGCLCHASENADGDAPHAQKGCTAQAWSDSELLRVWLKLAAPGRSDGPAS